MNTFYKLYTWTTVPAVGVFFHKVFNSPAGPYEVRSSLNGTVVARRIVPRQTLLDRVLHTPDLYMPDIKDPSDVAEIEVVRRYAVGAGWWAGLNDDCAMEDLFSEFRDGDRVHHPEYHTMLSYKRCMRSE